MVVNLNASDINTLAILGIADRQKGTEHIKFIRSMGKDKRKRYDYSKPDTSRAIQNYYNKNKETMRNELSFF